MRKGHDFRDYICPDGLCFKADHFEMGSKVGRVLFLRDYASYIKDEMIAKLSDFPRNLMLSIDILPIPTDEAIREVQSRILGIESDIARWQQRQNSRNNFTASIPYELEQLRAETKEFLDDLSTRDQRMIFANVTIVHMADTLEQLNADTETLQAIGLEQACQFSVLRYQQEDGLNTGLALWPAPHQNNPHPDNGIHRCFDAVPRAGDPGCGRHLLRRQCGQPKSADLQPEEAAEPAWLRAGCFRQR